MIFDAINQTMNLLVTVGFGYVAFVGLGAMTKYTLMDMEIRNITISQRDIYEGLRDAFEANIAEQDRKKAERLARLLGKTEAAVE